MKAIDDSTDAIASHFSRRPRNRNPSDPHPQRAGTDQSRASSGPSHALDSERSPQANRIDSVNQSSSQTAEPNRGPGSGKAEGPGGPTPWPCCNSDSPSMSEQAERPHFRWRSSIVVLALLAACGAPHSHAESTSNAAAAVRGFPTFPGATWDGDITTQEEDGQLTWLVSWTAPSPESAVRRFFMRTLGQVGWQFGSGSSAHELRLQREDSKLRGLLRFGQPEFGKSGTGVTLGIRDPRRRQNGCLKAVAWLPIYSGAEVRSCDLVHIPGARSLSVPAATADDVELAD